jgi:hypothetical protein
MQFKKFYSLCDACLVYYIPQVETTSAEGTDKPALRLGKKKNCD